MMPPEMHSNYTCHLQAADFFADSSALRVACSELAVRLNSKLASETKLCTKRTRVTQGVHDEHTPVAQGSAAVTESLADKVRCPADSILFSATCCGVLELLMRAMNVSC